MREYVRRGAAAVMSAALLFAGIAGSLPQNAAFPAITAEAAADDYPWSDYLKKDASWFGSGEALSVAADILKYQISGEGGWRKGMATEQTGDWAHSTIDNDVTTSQIRFLMRSYAQTGNQQYLDSAMKGVDCLFKMQYSNGGFMQNLNTPGTYHAHITLNDAAYLHVVQIMQEMSTKTGDFTAVSDEYAKKAETSLQKAIQCLLDMQVKVNGVRTVWGQQHDENTLAPAGARAYELPSLCSSESAGVVTFLYDYARNHPDRSDIAEAVNAAIEWFKNAALYNIKFDWNGDKSDKVVTHVDGAGPIWARFYTLNTQVPLFSDRDGGTYYDVAQISQERRTGYAWYGSWGKNVINLAPLDGTMPTEPEYSGEYIAKLLVHDIANGANWSIQDNLRVGSRIYGDRDFTVVTLPAELAGAEYVQSACDSKTFSSDLAELTAGQNLTAYAIVDLRLSMEQGIKPAWLSGWTHTDLIVNSSNTVTYEVYARSLSAGESITLGSNKTGQNVVNYFAAVQPAAAVQTTTTTTTTVTETTTTSTTWGTSSESTSASQSDDGNRIQASENPVQVAVGETKAITLSYLLSGTPDDLMVTGNLDAKNSAAISYDGAQTVTITGKTPGTGRITISDGSHWLYLTVEVIRAAETTTGTTAQYRKLTGDVDANGQVELRDAVLLAKANAGLEEISSAGRLNAECDGKDGIGSGDLKMLLNYLAGSIDKFPV